MPIERMAALADIDDVMKIIVTILVPAFWILAPLLSGRNKAKRRPPVGKPRPQPVPIPPAERGAAAAAPVGRKKPNPLEETLRREVDEFLRRAQGKPAEQQQRPRPQRPKLTPAERSGKRNAAEEAEVRRAPKPLGGLPASQLPSQAKKLAQSAQAQATQAQATQAQSRPLTGSTNWGSSVSEHVAEHLGGKEVASHAEHLGEDVAQADDRMQEHLHAVFDHQLGSLGRATQPEATVADRSKSRLAKEVVDLIRKPGGMRQLIIASEILRRPDVRR